MTALALAQMAYTSGSETLSTPRGTEYDAFSRTTRRLAAAAKAGRSGFVHMAHAIHENRRLWTVLAASVADQENALPDEIKARIFYLAQFTESHSRQILRGEASVSPLIEINTAIMRGLGRGNSK